MSQMLIIFGHQTTSYDKQQSSTFGDYRHFDCLPRSRKPIDYSTTTCPTNPSNPCCWQYRYTPETFRQHFSDLPLSRSWRDWCPCFCRWCCWFWCHPWTNRWLLDWLLAPIPTSFTIGSNSFHGEKHTRQTHFI